MLLHIAIQYTIVFNLTDILNIKNYTYDSIDEWSYDSMIMLSLLIGFLFSISITSCLLIASHVNGCAQMYIYCTTHYKLVAVDHMKMTFRMLACATLLYFVIMTFGSNFNYMLKFAYYLVARFSTYPIIPLISALSIPSYFVFVEIVRLHGYSEIGEHIDGNNTEDAMGNNGAEDGGNNA